MRIHYIPQFVLKEFKGDPSLLEFDKLDGQNIAKATSVQVAAQCEDFWSLGVEDGVMMEMDDKASKILKEKVYHQQRISLSTTERRTMAEWFKLLMLRTPAHLKRLSDLRKSVQADPHSFISGGDDFYSYLSKNQPLFQHLRQMVGGSPALALLYFHSVWEVLVRAGDPIAIESLSSAFDGQFVWHGYRTLADELEKMVWTWKGSDVGGFVIGDDPVCRYSPRHPGLNASIKYRDVEITIPLSRHLSLYIAARGVESPEVERAGEQTVTHFNRRQIANALQYVYGPTQAALRPDDPNAVYGF